MYLSLTFYTSLDVTRKHAYHSKHFLYGIISACNYHEVEETCYLYKQGPGKMYRLGVLTLPVAITQRSFRCSMRRSMHTKHLDKVAHKM